MQFRQGEHNNKYYSLTVPYVIVGRWDVKGKSVLAESTGATTSIITTVQPCSVFLVLISSQTILSVLDF